MNAILLYLSWLLAAIATTGSLYFSQVLELPPCSLCWWQRICMFPLVILFGVGYLKKDASCLLYTAPLVIIGLFISIYHNLLYYGVLEKGFSTCSAGVSCTTAQIQWLGFITIPLLALVAFTLLTIFLYFLNKNKGSLHVQK
jgi:disulfide bond formation protein DsbB